MQNDNIQPCPFCGDAPEILRTDYRCNQFGIVGFTSIIKCRRCEFEFRSNSSFRINDNNVIWEHDGHSAMIDRWNQRILPDFDEWQEINTIEDLSREYIAVNKHNDMIIGEIDSIGTEYVCSTGHDTVRHVTHYMPKPIPPRRKT